MDIKELFVDYQALLSIVVMTSTVVGVYYKLKIEMAKITIAIEEIKSDRKEKWEKQEAKCLDRKNEWDKASRAQKEKDDKMEAYISDILSGIGDLKTEIRGLKTDMDWVKKSK